MFVFIEVMSVDVVALGVVVVTVVVIYVFVFADVCVIGVVWEVLLMWLVLPMIVCWL